MEWKKAILDQIHHDSQDQPFSVRLEIEDDIRNGVSDEEIRKKWGGARPGAGRKPIKPALKKQKKAFSLSPESVQALSDLQTSLGLGSQSAVVEFLILRWNSITEHQLELFPDPDSEEIKS